MKLCVQCRAEYDNALTTCPKDGRALLLLGAGAKDLRSDRYLILGLIGTGGMSKVYRAYKMAMEKEVALKVLTGPDARDPELVERFRREATNTAQLRSPHTIRVYDFGQLESGEPYIEMELLRGMALDALIDTEAPMKPDRVVQLVLQICASLEEAHAQKRVHRDIKPSNLMIERLDGGKEHVTVLDFGLVKQVGVHSVAKLPTITDPASRTGTPQYMAPELWSDEFGAIGPGADLYALGIVIFQMLTGKRPFPKTSEISKVIANHLYQAPAPLGAHTDDPAITDRFGPIVARCLAKRPEERYATARELADALIESERALPPPAKEGGTAKKRPPGPPLGGPALPFFAAGVLFLIFLAAKIVELASDLGPGKISPRAVLAIESKPTEAAIFVDGAPTGLVTPSRFFTLAQRSIRVMLHRSGCAPASEVVSPEPGELKLAFDLECTAGRTP